MNPSQVSTIIRLTHGGWRFYTYPVPKERYEKLQCPYKEGKGRHRPCWFVHGDTFLCVGCPKSCFLNRPTGFPLPLPMRYNTSHPASPFKLTPAEMVTRKSLLRVDEVAYCLNVSERTVYDWVAEGRLRRTIDAPIRVPVDDVIRHMTTFDDE